MRILLVLTLLLLAFPAHAQIRKPGDDFIADPDWSPEFTQGMLAINQRDFPRAKEHLTKCVADPRKIDANCEFYLAIVYLQQADMANYRKWLNLAATHGQAQAAATVGVMERFK